MNTNEKELWVVAREGYQTGPCGVMQSWTACAAAVIAEHERRKAEQVGPEWKLPDPPDGEQWHRTDWTRDMLPSGFRPHLMGENDEPGDFVMYPKGWAIVNSECRVPSSATSWHRRTTRPLPVKPDPFAAEKAAFAAGKTIQCKDASTPWMDCETTPCWFHDVEYRVKPEPVLVPLGPDDVPPGSTLETEMGGWMMITSIGLAGVVCATRSTGCIKWEELKRRFKINRNNGLGWQPCSKIKPE